MRVGSRNAVQIRKIRRIQELPILVQHGDILFLKHAPIFAQHLIAIRIILAIFRHFVDEEQRQRLDAHVEILLFLLKVGDDRLANLHAPHIPFGHVAHHVALANDVAVGKRHRSGDRVDFRNGKALILFHFAGNIIEIVAHAQNAEFAVDGFLIANFQLHAHLRRFLGRKQYALHIQILIRAAEVFHLEALDFDLLHQPLVVGVQCVQHIDQIVLFGVCRGIIQAK